MYTVICLTNRVGTRLLAASLFSYGLQSVTPWTRTQRGGMHKEGLGETRNTGLFFFSWEMCLHLIMIPSSLKCLAHNPCLISREYRMPDVWWNRGCLNFQLSVNFTFASCPFLCGPTSRLFLLANTPPTPYPCSIALSTGDVLRCHYKFTMMLCNHCMHTSFCFSNLTNSFAMCCSRKHPYLSKSFFGLKHHPSPLYKVHFSNFLLERTPAPLEFPTIFYVYGYFSNHTNLWHYAVRCDCLVVGPYCVVPYRFIHWPRTGQS